MNNKNIVTKVEEKEISNSRKNKSTKYFTSDVISKVVNDNFRKKEFTIKLFAVEFNVSESYLWEKCNIVFGVSPKVLLDKRRVEDVKELIVKNRDLSLVKIMLESGFRSLSTLRQTFKRVEGMSVGEFKESYRKLNYK